MRHRGAITLSEQCAADPEIARRWQAYCQTHDGLPRLTRPKFDADGQCVACAELRRR